ncbi:MAG: 3-ketoacyl-ACP reductase [Actinomycetia bacterium]|nr:3-ketoacyl-ACP reductase [Actinomycetes bacterium]
MTFDAATFRLDGKVALVTGGTRGIGRAIAEAYATAGASVAVLARKADELDETRAALEALGARAVTVVGSAGDPDAVDRAVQACVSDLGGLDILVNNAATNPAFGPVVDVEPGALRKILEVNVEGPIRLVQAAWRAWMQEHGGSIINVASIGGIQPSPLIGVYNVSKGALLHLTRQLALELAPGVRVNSLAPGLVKTDFARALWEPDEARADAIQPLGRIGMPDDIAGAALFLASDAASWLTGVTLVVDGGALLA